MSYTYLQEQGAVSSAASFSDIPPYVLSRLNLTAEGCCSNGNATESCQSSQSGTMCEPLTEPLGAERSMSCAGGSRARTSLALEKAQDLTANAPGYGEKCGVSLAKYDPATHSLRTHQCSLLEAGYELLQTLPAWGLIVHGELLAVLVPGFVLTESESGFSVQGPTSSMWRDCNLRLKSLLRWHHPNGNLIEQWAQRYQTRIMPRTIEILMQWPEEWTDLKPLEMDKFQQWLNSHGKH
jgi:hypothetical protein